MYKKIISIVFAIFVMILNTIPASAVSNDSYSSEYTEYLGYVNQGILGEDISFEYWKHLKELSCELEKSLENSSVFQVVYDSTSANSTYSTYSMMPGDIFITNGTSSAGLTGHAAIAISKYSLLHIAGFGESVTTINLDNWHNRYTSEGWTKVYRNPNSSVAENAAQWAVDTYFNSSAVYMLTQDVSSTYYTYCSKIVWQSYYYGNSPSAASYLASGYILPYSLPGLINDVSLINTFE